MANHRHHHTSPLSLLLLGFIAVLSGCETTEINGVTVRYSPAKTVGQNECLRIAESYRIHAWVPQERNRFHGTDRSGIRVDTPDIDFKPRDERPGWWIPGVQNIGIPYQWGGFDTPGEFDRKLARGAYAGDIATKLKRAHLEAAVSTQSSGIDCSGFVSRCWRLERSYSTRELPYLCDRLNSYDELQKGDILNIYNDHVVMFAYWLDPARTVFMAYETGAPPTWKVLRQPVTVDICKRLGCIPYRYRNMRRN